MLSKEEVGEIYSSIIEGYSYDYCQSNLAKQLIDSMEQIEEIEKLKNYVIDDNVTLRDYLQVENLCERAQAREIKLKTKNEDLGNDIQELAAELMEGELIIRELKAQLKEKNNPK